jgi:hypothetical protein
MSASHYLVITTNARKPHLKVTHKRIRIETRDVVKTEQLGRYDYSLKNTSMDRRLGVIGVWSLFPGSDVHPKEIAWNRNAIAKKTLPILNTTAFTEVRSQLNPRSHNQSLQTVVPIQLSLLMVIASTSQEDNYPTMALICFIALVSLD